MTTTSDLATSFDAIAAEYAALRPTYPPALYDAVEELSGRPLAGSAVLDVGAGTGKGAAPLHERGARVVAAEPGPGMAAQFRAALPDVPLVRGSGDALPFAAGSFDLVTYAQAWHWTDPARSVPEALRVLRPGGALALWWNVRDRSVRWADAQERRLAERLSEFRREDITTTAPALLRGLGLGLAPVHREVGWRRTIPLAAHIANLATHSWLAVLGPEKSRPILAAEEEAVRAEFPDGQVTEDYTVRLTVVIR
ncbi:class I SAM-dependent methyltransferase [Streptomyces sp. MP131-18]|uniref:class I SAM-dependent methyltransferase n=1 Tax=Streptomyces sp. MP131-18 TaxID=1857892 RepID=UPI00097BDD77|nr:class I SAM-dependent methyltransferase [Streptomyces sp. MP131-18]ONK12279.1 putative S-adenosylmethionine-dependent methyltransferase [Streptomyces sp. MP131-18]